jgi:restriction endonuclease Mrr
MKYWEGVIHHTLELLGGEADLQEIYGKLPDFIDLTEGHLRITKWGGRPAYHHIVRSYITNMCQSGLLQRVSRGRYKIVEYEEASQ